MRVTREIDYSFRIMHCLAMNRDAKRGMSAPLIAETVCVPVRFALKILRKLLQNGLIRSYKGSSGGYELACAPSCITMKQIVDAIEGPITISPCLTEDNVCSRHGADKSSCYFHHIFEDVNHMISEKLNAVTLEMAVNHEKTKNL